MFAELDLVDRPVDEPTDRTHERAAPVQRDRPRAPPGIQRSLDRDWLSHPTHHTRKRPLRVARTTAADLYDAKGNKASLAWVRSAAADRFLV